MHDVLVLGASVMRSGGTKKLTYLRLLVCYSTLARHDQRGGVARSQSSLTTTRDSFLSTATICCSAAHHCAPVGKTAHWAAHSTVLHAAQHAAFLGEGRARSAHGWPTHQ